MKQLELEKEGDLLVASWSRWGRLRGAGGLVLKTAPLAFAALAIFFAPDVFLGDITEREPVRGLFWLSLAGLALAVGVLVGLFRLLRRVRWIFDGGERKVTAEVKTLMGAPAAGEAELRDVAALLVVSGGLFRRSALKMRLKSGEEEELFSGTGLGSEVDELAEELREFFRSQRYEVEVLREGSKSGKSLES